MQLSGLKFQNYALKKDIQNTQYFKDKKYKKETLKERNFYHNSNVLDFVQDVLYKCTRPTFILGYKEDLANALTRNLVSC